MHQNLFAELSLIIAVGAGIAIIMRSLKQPLIIGHILTGIIVGPSVLHLVKSTETIEVFSTIGIALLLFIIGLGLNPKVIKEVGKVATLGGLVQVVLITLFAWGSGSLLGLSRMDSIFFGVALSFSSTIIILKLLSDLKEQNRLYGKVSTGMLIVQDVLATIALLFVTSQNTGSFSPSGLEWLALKGLSIALPLILIGNFVLPKLSKLIAGSQEVLFLFALGWGFGSAALFERAGFSIEIGALLAGVALASLPYTHEISARLRPLRDFFIVVFFIALGTRLTFQDFGSIVPAILVATGIVIVIKPLLIMFIMGIMGYTKRTSFKTAVTMAQISEFSLVFVIVGNRNGLISSNLVSITTMVALVTITISSYLIIYSEKIYLLLKTPLSIFEKRKVRGEHETRQRSELILFGYQKGGHEFLKVFQSLGKRYVVIDYDPAVIEILENHKFPYLYGDATDSELLIEAGAATAKLIVSTISTHETNVFLSKLMADINPEAVVILHADSVQEAAELYTLGASYVVLPHYIGSERIGSFIRKNGLKKSEFKKYRDKHLLYLQSHYSPEIE
ncbi:MAG: cation:proton antiporter [Candidatus Saccharibacteria bacterium]